MLEEVDLKEIDKTSLFTLKAGQHPTGMRMIQP